MPGDTTILSFERSARRDPRWWLLFVVGGMFTAAGLTLDPAQNCNSSGDCAPWLVPVAAVMGIGALTMALGLLIGNPSRGSLVDVGNDRFTWWEGRIGAQARDAGSWPLSGIISMRVIQGDDDDSIHFYDENGERLPIPDTEIFPWPFEDWAARLVDLAPHIAMTIERR